MSKMSKWKERVVKGVYGVEGVLDEYKHQQIDKIGQRGFLILYGLSLLNSIIFGIYANWNEKTAFTVFAIAQIFILFIVMPAYMTIAINQAQLTNMDLLPEEYALKRKQATWKIIGATLIFLFSIHLLKAVFPEDNQTFWQMVWNHKEMIKSLVTAGIWGSMMFYFRLNYLKKQIYNNEE